MKKEVFISAALAVMLGVSSNGFGQDLESWVTPDPEYGNWTGKLKTPMGDLPLVLGLYKDLDGTEKCYLLSPKQSKDTIPAVLDFNSQDSVAVSSPAIGFKYNGCKTGNYIYGDMSQRGITLPLDLEYVDGKHVFLEGRRRPQTPQPPFSYKTEEVVFSHAEASLSGTITLPADMSGKVPVVIMVSGSGQQNRDEEMFEHKPFAVIADYLAKNGIASLRYDDRGMGNSTGNLQKATTFDFAKDAEAGIAFLRNDPRFSKVGILGHSEGGSIAFIIGAKGSADFLVTLAAPAVKGDEVLVAQFNRVTEIEFPIPEKARKSDEKQLKKIQKFKKKNGIDGLPDLEVAMHLLEPMTVQKYREEFYGKIDTWFDAFLDYDPTQNIQNTSCPVFALNGTKDCQVIAEQNLDQLKKLVKSPKSQFKKYPDLNHLFQHCDKGLVYEYMDIEETISEEVLKDIAEWVKGL